MTVTEALPYVSVLVALLCFWVGRVSASKDEGRQDGAILTDIDYIKKGIDDIKDWQKKQESENIEILSRITAVEQSVKQAHHRINEIREHCCGD